MVKTRTGVRRTLPCVILNEVKDPIEYKENKGILRLGPPKTRKLVSGNPHALRLRMTRGVVCSLHPCHPEQREGSLRILITIFNGILRVAQNDTVKQPHPSLRATLPNGEG